MSTGTERSQPLLIAFEGLDGGGKTTHIANSKPDAKFDTKRSVYELVA